MPPSWSSRLLSTGSSSNNTPTRSTTANNESRGLKPSPRPPPQAAFDPPPTLHSERTLSSPPRPQTARQHQHGRSVSHPLPRIFRRQKSARDLGGGGGFNDTDVPLDDDLVPVLDEPAAFTPTRVISGKKGKPEDDGKVTRRCVCCDCKVSVPREIERFRCLACVTINDLKPAGKGENKDQTNGKKAETFPGGLPPIAQAVPLTVERTRAIIDRCLTSYLESRCRRLEGPSTSAQIPPTKADSPTEPEARKTPAVQTLPIRPRQPDSAGLQLVDAPLSSSPPDTPDSSDIKVAASATIRDLTDIDLFSYMRHDTPPPQQQSTPHGPGPPSSLPRKPLPSQPKRKPPPPPVSVANRTPSQRLQPNGSMIPNGLSSPRPQLSPRPTQAEMDDRKRYERVKMIFKPLEDYLMATFGDHECLNKSFSTVRALPQGRTRSESNIATPPPEPIGEARQPSPMDGLQELDAKTLLLGDLGENSSWWTGKLDRLRGENSLKRKNVGEGSRKAVSSKSPNVNWAELQKWYELIHSAGEDWQLRVKSTKAYERIDLGPTLDGFTNVRDIENDLEEARDHAVRAILKLTENLLKRPSRPLKEPEDIRFLLVLLANPSLYPSTRKTQRSASRTISQPIRTASGRQTASPRQPISPQRSPVSRDGMPHAGLLKRICGLLAYSSDNCHRYLIGWFARFDEEHFVRIVDLVASFVTYRISRRWVVLAEAARSTMAG